MTTTFTLVSTIKKNNVSGINESVIISCKNSEKYDTANLCRKACYCNSSVEDRIALYNSLTDECKAEWDALTDGDFVNCYVVR